LIQGDLNHCFAAASGRDPINGFGDRFQVPDCAEVGPGACDFAIREVQPARLARGFHDSRLVRRLMLGGQIGNFAGLQQGLSELKTPPHQAGFEKERIFSLVAKLLDQQSKGGVRALRSQGLLHFLEQVLIAPGRHPSYITSIWARTPPGSPQFPFVIAPGLFHGEGEIFSCCMTLPAGPKLRKVKVSSHTARVAVRMHTVHRNTVSGYPYDEAKRRLMRRTFSVSTNVVCMLGLAAAAAQAQNQPAAAPTAVFKVNSVAKSTKAINYRHRSGATEIDFAGTAIMSNAKG